MPCSSLRYRQLSIIAPLSMLAAGVLATPADAGLLLWNNAAGGAAATSGNWSPIQVPTSADDLTFNLAATYAITWSASANLSLSQTYRFGTVTNTITSPHAMSGGLTVGDLNGDTATMTLTTGTLTANASSIIGDATGSVGTVNVNDDDADLIIDNGGDLTVGLNGDANLNITNGGRVVVDDQFIAGSNATSSPTILVSDFTVGPIATSNLDVLGLSQSRIGGGGDVAMTISDGAFARFAGDVVVANGSASISSITIEDPGLLDARLLVNGDLLVGQNTSAGTAAGIGTVTANADGTVDVGGLLALGGDTLGGTGSLNVNGTGIVNTTDMEIGSGGTLTLNGGTVTSDNAIANLSGGVITGTGVINADINNNGVITPTGAGLTINGILSHTAATGINGTKIHFGPDGGYTGSGTCVAEITGDATSSITPTGTLSIGKITSTAGFFFLGDLNVGGNIVTLLDSNQAVLGGETTINSGRIECPAGIGVQNGGALRGDGLLVGTLTCAGVLDPFTPNNSSGGLITVQGNLNMNETGQLHARINGAPASGNYDRVNVSGTALFNGAVHIDVAPGLILRRGQQFILMNAVGGGTGTFDSITYPPQCNGATIVLVYSSTAAIALVRPPDTDVNQDGFTNVSDLLAVINNWGPCGDPGEPECGPANVDGTGNGDGGVDVLDLLLVINHWGQCQGG